MRKQLSRNHGFTLIEIIVTLTLASILAVLLVQFMGTSIYRSMEPALSMQQGLTLQGIFENMTADYKLLLLTDSTPLSTFKINVEGGKYGSYTWSTKYVTMDSTQTESLAPCSSDCNILKITISSGGHSLTALFTQ